MNTRRICSFTLSGLMAFAFHARAEDKAELPAGHPPIAKPGAGAGSMPAGHPDISKTGGGNAGGGALPPGHPPMKGGMGGMGGMPGGHPPIGGMAQPAAEPATSATLAIRVLQGTKDAPAAKLETATVELWHRGAVIKTVEAKLDANGASVLSNLPIELAFQPVVKVNYNGVEYMSVGKAMDKFQAAQQMDVQVYELAEKAPQWQVPMRHLMITPTAEGLHVVEVIGVENPTDRTWLGTPREEGGRVTMTLPIPMNAQDVKTGSAITGGCCDKDRGTLTNSAPLTPGVTQIRFGYQIPMKDGKASLTVTNPALVKNMMVFVTDVGSAVQVEGLDSMGTQDMGHGKANMYRGTDMQAGSKTTITVAAPAAAGQANPGPMGKAPSGSAAPKVIAGVGGGLILAVGAGVIFAKGPRKAS